MLFVRSGKPFARLARLVRTVAAFAALLASPVFSPALLAAAAAPQLPHANGSWDPTFFSPGVQPLAHAVTADAERVFVVGPFHTAGAVIADGIAAWDRSTHQWTALAHEIVGTNSQNPKLDDVVLLQSDLYVAGSFTSIDGVAVSNVARWDGTKWHAVGSLTAEIVRLRVMNGELYAFPAYNPNPFTLSKPVKLDGSDWIGVTGNTIRDIYVDGSDNFQVDESKVYRWDGSNLVSMKWSPQDGFGHPPQTLVKFKGELYAGGGFQGLGPDLAARVARWDGQDWHKLGDGIPLAVHQLVATDDALYANTGSSIWRWDGVAWTQIGGMASTFTYFSELYDLDSRGKDVFVAGRMRELDDTVVHNVARWEASKSRWRDVADERGKGLDGPVSSIATVGNETFVAGNFGSAGDENAPHVAAWNGSSWRWVGQGTAGTVGALVSGNLGTFAAGIYPIGDQMWNEGVLRYDGNQWVPSGVTGFVSSMLMAGNTLYVNGEVDTPEGDHGILASWNGTKWTVLLDNTQAYGIYALAWWNSKLYIGGEFSNLDGLGIANIAQQSGSTWKKVGAGLGGGGGYVETLAATSDSLSASGHFDSAGNHAASGMASWDGSDWEPFDLGQGYEGLRLSSAADELYAGPAPGLYRRREGEWEQLGADFNNGAWVAESRGTLFAFGDFTAIGTHPAGFFVPWHECASDAESCTTTTTSTTMPPEFPCGDANHDGSVTASDAAAALRTAVGDGSCGIADCDVDESGAVTAGDALAILRIAVGLEVPGACGAAS